MLDKLIYFALLVLLVVTPLPYGAVEGWSIALWEVGVFALVALWATQSALQGEIKISFNPLVWPMLALLVVAIIQILPGLSASESGTISHSPFATSQFAIKLFASICFFLLFATFVNSDERRAGAVKLIIAVCTSIALIGIGQRYLGKTLWQRGTMGPFVNRNHFAGFLEMGVGLAGGQMLGWVTLGRAVKVEWLAVYGSCALVMCSGIVLSASRGGVLALGAEIVFLGILAVAMFFFGWRSKKTGQAERSRGAGFLVRVAAALVISAAAIIAATALVGSEDLVQNFSQIQAETKTEFPVSERFSRPDIWRATIRLIKDYPLLGVGLGAFQFAYTRYDQSSGLQRVEQSHNDYLQILADAGIIGGLIALVYAVLLFSRGFLASRTRNLKKRAIVFGAMAGCFAIAVHSLVEFNLQVTSNAQLFLALAALATTERGQHTSHESEE